MKKDELVKFHLDGGRNMSAAEIFQDNIQIKISTLKLSAKI